MDILETIHLRQSIGKLKPDPVPRELVEKLLDAAVQAPNHYKVRPWQFIVLSGEALLRLGEVMAQGLLLRSPEMPAEGLKAEANKALRAPLIIAVAAALPENPKVLLVENICAAAAATQNLLLAVQACGLAAKWRTGAAADDPQVKRFLGLQPEQPLVAFVYIGYADGEFPPPQRPGFADRTTWMD